jgi:hypothetical protein
MESREQVKRMADGWRGAGLGYAGGRTGYNAIYGPSDAFRGTSGTHWRFGDIYQNRSRAESLIFSGVAVASIIYFARKTPGVKGDFLSQIRNLPLVKQTADVVDAVTDPVVDGFKAVVN